MKEQKLLPEWALISTIILVTMFFAGLSTGRWMEAAMAAAFSVWFYPVYWLFNRWADARIAQIRKGRDVE